MKLSLPVLLLSILAGAPALSATYHIGAECGGPPQQLMTNANAQCSAVSHLSTSIPAGAIITSIGGTISLKSAGEVFFTLNGGDGTSNGPLIAGEEFINYPDKDAKTWQINLPLPSTWASLGPTIQFNFQYDNMTPFPQSSGFEVQLNIITP